VLTALFKQNLPDIGIHPLRIAACAKSALFKFGPRPLPHPHLRGHIGGKQWKRIPFHPRKGNGLEFKTPRSKQIDCLGDLRLDDPQKQSRIVGCQLTDWHRFQIGM
jgi:hypothetical protein